jgi:ABC-type transport system involved in cytochrome bd biosynthesis fused ATPase/permease subunit
MQVLRGISFTYLTENLGFFLKKSAFKVSINKSMVDIERIGAQTLAYIITTNCEDLKHLGGHFIGDILENLTTIVVGLAIAFAFSWQVTLVALGVFPFILLAGKLQMSFSQGMQSNSDKVHKKTLENII